jgi:lipoprotein-anchoring transpeptidase ErfK/SrfK
VLLGTTVATGLAAGCSEDGRIRGVDGVTLSSTPGNGAARARPDVPIEVRAAHGTIENVTVANRGERVEGAMDAYRTAWRSRWTLQPGTGYTVTATALGRDGKTRTLTSAFVTAKPKRTVATTIEAPDHKETVGVGMPVILHFDRAVTDRAAAERALEITANKPATGAWHWFGNQTVVFRTRKHWPRQTKVRFRGHLGGVRMAKGDYYGRKNLDIRFRVGDEHVSVANENTHKMVVHRNGKKVRTVPVSMGRGGVRKYTTTNGNHLTMEKGSPVIMDSSTVGCGPGCAGYYRQTVYSAVRISDSGEYVHAAPWSVGSQGHSNVSHGCVNVSPSNAKWFYGLAQRGDPFKVTGSNRELEPDNGWGYWQMPWKAWVKGSALKRALHLGPQSGNQVATN